MSRHLRSGVRPRGRDEHGAVMVMTALFVVIIVGICTLAVDLGMQRVVRRDMQALADVVALDMARDLDQGKTKAEIDADPVWDAHLAQSVARNNSTLGDAPTVGYKLGTVTASGTFVESAPSEIPTAVMIDAASKVNFAFAGGQGGAMRTAVATAHPPTPPCDPSDPTCVTTQTSATACFQVGSWAANLSSANSTLLDALLGDALNVTGVGYAGLATASVTLGDLATELGVATVDQLATTQVKVGNLFKAAAAILQRQGDAANAALLLNLANPSSSLPEATAAANIVAKTIQLGAQVGADGRRIGMFDVGNAGDAGLDANLNVLDMVAASAFIANGTNALALPASVNLPGVANVVATVTVIQRPQLACGPVGTQVETSQVEVHVTGRVAPTLPAPFTLPATTAANFSVDVTVGQATGTLSNIICSNLPTLADPEGIDVAVQTGLLEADVNATVGVSFTGLTVNGLISGLLGFLGIDTFRGDATLTVGSHLNPIAGANQTVTFRHEPQAYDTILQVGTKPQLQQPSTPVLTTSTDIGTLLGLVSGSNKATVDARIVSSLSASLTGSLISPIVNTVNSTLLGPLSDLLGVRVAGADVWAKGRPTCQGPVLVG